MKAKRLRALLVAGLLSLAPAVTLTSCSGGGGGGGGTAAVNQKGLPLSLKGRVVTARFNNQFTVRVSFIEEAGARVEGILTRPGAESWTATGTYSWQPGENEQATAEISGLRLDDAAGSRGTNLVNVTFSNYSGKLSVVQVTYQQSKNDELMTCPASSCTLQ